MLEEEKNLYKKWIEMQSLSSEYPHVKLLQAASELGMALDWYDLSSRSHQTAQMKLAERKAKIWAKELEKRMKKVG